MHRFYFILFSISLFAVSNAATPAMAQGYGGRDFWVAFPQNAIAEGDKILSLSFYITAESRATGTIAYLDSNTHFSVETGSSIEIDIDTEVEIRSSGKTERKALHVVSDQDISLYVVSHRPASTDSYMAIPTPYLGKDYIIAGYSSLHNGPMTFTSQAAIVATEKNTLVTIHLAGQTREGLPKGRTISFVLDSGNTYQLQGSHDGNDLTGTTVTATKPIAFFTGHTCAQVPASHSYCDMLLEMEPPSDDWGKSYIITKFEKKSNYVIRVIARDDSTVVLLNGEKVAWLMRGDFYEQDTLGFDAIVSSSKPVLVAQYCTSSSSDNPPVADPFMILEIPTDRFVKEVTTTSVTTGTYENYLNIIVPDSGKGTLSIDGSLVTSGNFPFHINLISERKFPSAKASVFTFQVPSGRHLLRCNTPIAVYSYGYGIGNDIFDSYGHGCGMELRK